MIDPDPGAIARDALLLVRTGRCGMALRLLEKLPDAIETTLGNAGWRAYAPAMPPVSGTGGGSRGRPRASPAASTGSERHWPIPSGERW